MYDPSLVKLLTPAHFASTTLRSFDSKQHHQWMSLIYVFPTLCLLLNSLCQSSHWHWVMSAPLLDYKEFYQLIAQAGHPAIFISLEFCRPRLHLSMFPLRDHLFLD